MFTARGIEWAAGELVRSLPTDTVRALSELAPDELERVFNRALDNAIAERLAAGLVVDFVRRELRPLIDTAFRVSQDAMIDRIPA